MYEVQATGHLPETAGQATHTLEKITLVVEHPPTPLTESQQAGIVRDLALLFSLTESRISLVHALSNPMTEFSALHLNADLFGQQVAQRIHQQNQARQTFRAALAQAGFQVISDESCGLEAGERQRLLDFTQETGQELLVLCGAYANGQSSLMARSQFAYTLATHAALPVLLLKKPLSQGQLRLRLLFAVDGTDATLTAARKLASLLPHPKLSVLLATVQNPVYPDNAALAPFVNQSVLQEALENNAAMTFEMVRDLLARNRFELILSKRLEGSAATELGYLAEMENPDLLVVGSHNRKGFLAWVMGSVSAQLLHWDTHNILVIR